MSSQENVSVHPTVLWAQKDDKIFLTIEIWDVHEKKLSFTENSISFSGRKGDTKQLCAFDFEFYSPIKPDRFEETVSGRSVFLIIEKKEASSWPRLTKSSNKLPYIKTDFDRWEDPEGDDEHSGMFPGGFDFSNMSNFGGMEGLGDMDEDAELEDDEEEPLDQEIEKHLAKEKQDV